MYLHRDATSRQTYANYRTALALHRMVTAISERDRDHAALWAAAWITASNDDAIPQLKCPSVTRPFQ